MSRVWTVIVGVALGMGCTAVAAETGQAVIRGTSEGSSVTGTARLTDTPDGLQVAITVAGVPPGLHGIHIHEYGDCGDGGKAAGGHFNPHGMPHGFFPDGGPGNAHTGDLGNIEVGSGGSGKLELTLLGPLLAEGPYSVAGRAFILHEQPDDFGQPTGNAGGRIGCGAIVLTKE